MRLTLIEWLIWLCIFAIVATIILIPLKPFIMDFFLGPCHSQHEHTRFVPAHTINGHCIMWSKIGDVRVCTLYHKIHVPDKCHTSVICDARCKDMNEWEEHDTYVTAPTSDPRCATQ